MSEPCKIHRCYDSCWKEDLESRLTQAERELAEAQKEIVWLKNGWDRDSLKKSADLSEARKQVERYKQALEAIWFGSLEANFKQCLQTPQEIAKDALAPEPKEKP